MEKQIMVANIDKVARQRNLFLVLLLGSVFSLSIVSLKLAMTSERVIMVPSLGRDMWVSDLGVSVSYIEEAAAMYLPLLLDLDADSIDWKKELLMTHVSKNDPSHMKAINDYFAATKERYKQFTLSTHFAVKSFEVDAKNMAVKASGTLISRFGERGYSSIPATYGLNFEWVAGKLLLKEFIKLSKEEGKDEEQKNENAEQAN